MDRLARVSSLLLGLLIIGCASSPPVPPTASPVGVDADRLDGRTYLSSSVIEDGTERSLVPGTLIRLSFAAGRLGAEAGCNSMGAPYEIVDGRLHIGEMATTLIGCPAPRAAQDTWLSSFLRSSPLLRMAGGDLILESGATRITFVEEETAALAGLGARRLAG